MGLELDLAALDNWLTDHFEELVDQYGGQVVAVVDGEVVAVTETEKQADDLAREAYPDSMPFVFPVPTGEELICLL